MECAAIIINPHLVQTSPSIHFSQVWDKTEPVPKQEKAQIQHQRNYYDPGATKRRKESKAKGNCRPQQSPVLLSSAG
jgi:hypothetical protein